MNNQGSDNKDEKSTLLSKGEKNHLDSQREKALSDMSQNRTSNKVDEMRNQIKDEAAKLKSNLINIISSKPIPGNQSKKKDEILVNPIIKSSIV